MSDSEKHFALFQRGEIAPHVFTVLPESRLEQGLGAFLRAYLGIWSEWVFKYDTSGTSRQTYTNCVAQGNWKGAFGAFRRSSSYVYTDVVALDRAGYDPAHFEETLAVFRDGLMHTEPISLEAYINSEKIDEDSTEV